MMIFQFLCIIKYYYYYINNKKYIPNEVLGGRPLRFLILGVSGSGVLRGRPRPLRGGSMRSPGLISLRTGSREEFNTTYILCSINLIF